MAEVLMFANNNGGRYIHDSLYESYIESKIESEERLAKALKEQMVLKEADYSSIVALHESSIGDKIKVKWKKFVAFIKGLVARFMESMSNILYNEKDYLEKYKDIILKKQPKSNLSYSYTGNYEEGIKRITNTVVPLFEYEKYKNAFDAEDDGDLAEAIMQGKQFKYDDGETLDEQFKEYYLVSDSGVRSGSFSELRMIDLYNFCYNFSKIKAITDKDLARLDASTSNIEKEIIKRINANNTNTVTNQNTNSTTTTATNTTSTTDNNSGSENNTATGSKEESALLLEADDNKEQSKGVQITSNEDKGSSDFTKNASSTDKRDVDAEKAAADRSGNADVEAINNASSRWIRVCRSLIAAKCTACQQIAKDYMAIIRAHVRSYGGKDDNTSDNKSKDKATQYKKENPDSKKADNEAKQAEKEADNEENKAETSSNTGDQGQKDSVEKKARNAGRNIGNTLKNKFKK